MHLLVFYCSLNCFHKHFWVWQNLNVHTVQCWITYMLTLAIRGLALSTTRIILMLKMQWLKYLRTIQNKNKMHIYILILGSFIKGMLDKIYLLEDWWLSFVQAVWRFLFPMVSSLYASSAFCTQISFNPTIYQILNTYMYVHQILISRKQISKIHVYCTWETRTLKHNKPIQAQLV